MQLANWITLIITAFIALVGAKPATRLETDPELTAGYVEGDMILPPVLRNGLRSPVYKWPNNTIHYKFFTQFDEPHKNHILRAMQLLESVSCIRFKEASAETKNYLNITGLPSGCFSSVGFLNQGAQKYNLQLNPLYVGCFRLGTIVHELLHTLGFYHMQSAFDRDEYVRIVKENIQKGATHNFRKYSEKKIDHYDEEYDYGSVLHYPPYAFSVNGKKTIIALKENEAASRMGQRRGMSKLDINKLNVMYQCPVSN